MASGLKKKNTQFNIWSSFISMSQLLRWTETVTAWEPDDEHHSGTLTDIWCLTQQVGCACSVYSHWSASAWRPTLTPTPLTSGMCLPSVWQVWPDVTASFSFFTQTTFTCTKYFSFCPFSRKDNTPNISCWQGWWKWTCDLWTKPSSSNFF